MSKSIIQKKFEALQENYTPVNVIKYIDFLRTRPVKEVLENAKYIFVEPTMGAEFMLETVQNLPEGSEFIMESAYHEMIPFISKAAGVYENTEHLNTVIESARFMENKFQCFDAKADTIRILQEQLDTIDSYLGINEDGIVMEGAMDALVRFNTKLTGPLIKHGARTGSNIGVSILKSKHKSKADAIKAYIKNVKSTIEHLEKEKKKYSGDTDFKDKMKGTMTYGPGTVAQIEKMIMTLEEAIKYQEGKLKVEEKSVNENIGTMAPDIVYAEEDCESIPLLKKKAELDFSINFVKTFMDETEEINMESFNAMMRAAYRYDNLVTEGVGDAVKGAAIKANNGMRKVANKIRKGSNERHRVGVAVKKIPQHVDSLVTNTIGQIGKMDKNERRKRIIEGGFKFKLFKIIRNAILVGAAWMISPALAAIGILAHLILDRQLDNKVRDELLDELEMELKMTREKLKDAEQKGDQKKKYQLMRIENALDKDIKRVRFRLNTIKVSKNGGVRV